MIISHSSQVLEMYTSCYVICYLFSSEVASNFWSWLVDSLEGYNGLIAISITLNDM